MISVKTTVEPMQQAKVPLLPTRSNRFRAPGPESTNEKGTTVAYVAQGVRQYEAPFATLSRIFR
jgi:hypothetical protein